MKPMVDIFELVTDPEDDDRLNDTDQAIIGALKEGRETTGSLAERLERHPQTIRDRLRWLREWNYIEYYHKETGLHTLKESDE